MSSNCSKSTQIENRDTMEEFFELLQNTEKNRATIEVIITKDSNRDNRITKHWVTIEK